MSQKEIINSVKATVFVIVLPITSFLVNGVYQELKDTHKEVGYVHEKQRMDSIAYNNRFDKLEYKLGEIEGYVKPLNATSAPNSTTVSYAIKQPER